MALELGFVAKLPGVCMDLNAEQGELLSLARHQPPEASLTDRSGP